MHRMRSLFFAIIFVCAPPLFAQQFANEIRSFEQFAAEEMARQKIPGISVAVKSGDFEWSRGFGFADVENQVPAKAESSYRMASVTKPMTAVAVLELVEEGKIDLDAEVQTYVPYYPRKQHKVTVRQLLAHQGGISHYRDYSKEGRIREPKNTREAIAIFADFDLINEPGTAYSYSSYGFNLLGAVIEGASGKSYGEYMTETVWKPLGMTSTRMDDPRALIPNRVTGYTLGDDGTLRRSEYVDISSRFAGGGTRSTVTDMIRFIDGIAGGKVLKAETVDGAWTQTPTRDRRYTSYGLGFSVYTRNGRWVVAHSGSQQETRTLMMMMPRERFAIAIASNFEDANLGAFENRLIELFLGDPELAGARAADEATNATWRAMNEAYHDGLMYYRRHGKPMTSDPRELAKAFSWFRESMTKEKIVADGRHPVAGEPLTKVGSYMASVLAKSGDLTLYHREGPLRFFADYNRVATQHRFDRAFVARVNEWSPAWERVRGIPFDALEANREALESAALKPDYARELIDKAEEHAQRGEIEQAVRVANLGLDLYPRSAGLNGVMGVLVLLSGDRTRAKSLLAKSVEIDPRGYARPAGLLNIADFLARSAETKPVAIALVEIAGELHPQNAALKSRLEELKK